MWTAWQETMTFFVGILRFLFWLLILSWGVALARRLLGWLFRGTDSQRETVGQGNNDTLKQRRLVRDPVCGTHVAEVLAIPLREGSELLYFCSKECRDKYLGQAQRKAANG
jgi:YHS domain-containing protein